MGEGLSSDSGVVLFIDDDPDVLLTAEALLRRHGLSMRAARRPGEAWSVLATEAVDVVLLDLNFQRGETSGAEGLAWLRDIRAHDPDAAVVVVTGHSGLSVAVEAMKSGASDFVTKPWNNARFLETIEAARQLRRRRRVASDSVSNTSAEISPMLGESAQMQAVRGLIDRVAPTEAPVMILGPAGSGRTLAARTLHARSRRSSGPFVTLDVQGLAATDGAAIQHAVTDARDGTLFLDDVGRLSADAQRALAVILEQGGGPRLVSAATGGREAVDGLRPELASRLSIVEVFLPPLSARGEDAGQLAEHFVRLFAKRYGLAPKRLDEAARALLAAAPPLGEVRGLSQAMERAVVLSAGPVIAAADLAPGSAPGDGSPAPGELNLARSEKALVEAALKRHGHNISQAARDLGLTRTALYRRMVKHGL